MVKSFGVLPHALQCLVSYYASLSECTDFIDEFKINKSGMVTGHIFAIMNEFVTVPPNRYGSAVILSYEYGGGQGWDVWGGNGIVVNKSVDELLRNPVYSKYILQRGGLLRTKGPGFRVIDKEHAQAELTIGKQIGTIKELFEEVCGA